MSYDRVKAYWLAKPEWWEELQVDAELFISPISLSSELLSQRKKDAARKLNGTRDLWLCEKVKQVSLVWFINTATEQVFLATLAQSVLSWMLYSNVLYVKACTCRRIIGFSTGKKQMQLWSLGLHRTGEHVVHLCLGALRSVQMKIKPKNTLTLFLNVTWTLCDVSNVVSATWDFLSHEQGKTCSNCT